MRHFWILATSLVALLASHGAAAQRKADIALTGAGKAPVQRTQNNYQVSILGNRSIENIRGRLADGHSTFNRPIDCKSLSTVGNAAAYDTLTVTNHGARTASLALRMGAVGNPGASCPASFDTVVVVYDSFFSPASPLTNCVVVNDDASSSDHCSTLKNIEIAAGKSRVIVLTQYQPGGTLDYEVAFNGTVPVTLQSFSIE